MRDNFDACLSLTLRFEGGYVDDPRDPGGATNLGITRGTLSEWRGHTVTKADVKALTREDAAAIYRAHYWTHINGDALPAGVDCLLFDIAVNSGPARALDWDAKIGHLPPVARIKALDARRRSFWRGLRTFVTFGRGWMARENAVLAAALAMAARAA